MAKGAEIFLRKVQQIKGGDSSSILAESDSKSPDTKKEKKMIKSIDDDDLGAPSGKPTTDDGKKPSPPKPQPQKPKIDPKPIV